MAALAKPGLHLLLLTTLCLSGAARAQSGGASVRVSGGVSKTVALSSPLETSAPADGVLVTSSLNADRSLTVSISGITRDLTVVRVPVQIRSNTAYSLLAAAKSGGADLASLHVVGARPTGNLVAADAVEDLSVAATFDARPGAYKINAVAGFNHPNLSSLAELLSGPRISLGGTLLSPQNAVEVTLSAAVEPRADNQGWVIELLLSAAPSRRL